MAFTLPFKMKDESGYWVIRDAKGIKADEARERWIAEQKLHILEKEWEMTSFQNGVEKAKQAIANKMGDYLDPYSMKKIAEEGTRVVYEKNGEFGVYAKGNGQLLRAYPDKESALEFLAGKR